MLNLFRDIHPGIPGPSIALLPLLFIAACGLGMDNAARLARAQAAFESSEYRAAIIDAKNILEQEPQNREARLLLGRSSIRVNDAATAEKELRRAIELGSDLRTVAVDLGRALLSLRRFEQLLEEIQPELAQNETERLGILRMRGDAMMGLQRPGDARDMYLEVLAADGDDMPARLGVVSSYVAEENNAEARKSLDEALRIEGKYVPARLASGSLYLAMLDPGAAVDEFALAHELASTASDTDAQVSALVGLIESRLAQNDLGAAKVAAAQLQEFAPDNLSTIYVTARIAYMGEDYETAQAKLQQVLKAAPEYRPAQFLLAAVHFKRGNMGQAEMHLSSVISAAPDNADARKLMAEIRLHQHRADEAVDVLRPLLGSTDTDAGALNLAVRASLEAGQYNNAIQYLREEIENKPDNVDLQLDLAAAYLAAGQVDEAETLLSSSPDDSAQNAYRRDLLQVMSPLRRGDSTTALRDAEAMAVRWPEDARVRNLIGGIALSTDDPDLARESFMAARRLAPADLSTYYNVARVDIEQGDFDAARGQYLAALEQQPESIEVMVALARLEARAEKSDAALQWLEKARAADPAAIMPRLLLARLYISERSFESATQVAYEAVRLEGSNAEARNLLGLAQQELDQNADALANFEQAARLDPEEAAYRMNQARAQAASGNYALAERTLSGSGGIDLDNIQSSVMIASLKARQGDSDAALKIAKDLQARYPDNGIPFALEAELLAAASRFGEAAAAYDKALSLRKDDRRLAVRAFQVRTTGELENPEAPLLNYLNERPLDTELRLVVAQSHQARGETARAIEEYEQVVSMAPDSYVALNNLAWEYFQSGDPRAEETARSAYEQSPQDGSVADTLGWIQVQKGNLDEGIPMLRQAVENGPDNPEVRYHLAAALAAAGDKAEARRILEDILDGADGFAARQEAEELLTSL
ncbi:MAG: XrtA/PEP-CTERM system TPR-repeat protein PrsT [Woeseia sp.]